jgi:hypothetical protein
LPPGFFAARFFAAVMRPPLDFFAMSSLLHVVDHPERVNADD